MRKAVIVLLACLAALTVLSEVDSRSAAAGEGPRYWLQTIAGSGRKGVAVDGDARDAVFQDISGVAFGDDGTIYIADSDNGVRYLKDGVVGSIFLRDGIDVVYDVALYGDYLYASATLSLVPGEHDRRHTIFRYNLAAGAGEPRVEQLCAPGDRRRACRESLTALTMLGPALIGGTFSSSTAFLLEPDGTEFHFAGHGHNEGFGYGTYSLNEGGAAQGAWINIVSDVSAEPSTGAVYIADGNSCRIRRVAANGVITTVAGGGGSLEDHGEADCGFSGDGGPGPQARLGGISVTVAAGPRHDVFIGHILRIRRVDRHGIIRTIAGYGEGTMCDRVNRCCEGDDLPALEAEIGRPLVLAADGDGVVYFAENDACPRLRVLRPMRP